MFKSSNSTIFQRVPIPKERLLAAKILMFLSLGLCWWWWRYFATRCPDCNAVFALDDAGQEKIGTYQVHGTRTRTRTFRTYNNPLGRAGSPLPDSVTEVDIEEPYTETRNSYRRYKECCNCKELFHIDD